MPRGWQTSSRRDLNQLCAFEQFAGDVLPGFGLRDERLQPRSEAIDPRFDRVLVAPDVFDDERAGPGVVVERHQRRIRPRPLASGAGGFSVPARWVAAASPDPGLRTSRCLRTPASRSWPSAKISAVTTTNS